MEQLMEGLEARGKNVDEALAHGLEAVRQGWNVYFKHLPTAPNQEPTTK